VLPAASAGLAVSAPGRAGATSRAQPEAIHEPTRGPSPNPLAAATCVDQEEFRAALCERASGGDQVGVTGEEAAVPDLLDASAKSLLEPRVVAYGGEVVVSARVLAEPRE
jgi:hypothetical protein